MPGSVQAPLIGLLALPVCCYAAWMDIRHRLLPNGISLVLLALGFCRWLLGWDLEPALWAAGLSAVCFAFGILLFMAGWVGGGDVKFISSALFLLGGNGFGIFFVVMSLTGGALAIAMLIQRGAKIISGIQVEGSPSVPYGVAIASAVVVVVLLQCRPGLGW